MGLPALQTNGHAAGECFSRLRRLSRKIAEATRAAPSRVRGTPADSRDPIVLIFGPIPDRATREQAALKPRIRQLLCLWLVTVIALLPVSGSLLAASPAAGSDDDMLDVHMGHVHHGSAPGHGPHPHEDARHGPAADFGAGAASDHHDCGNSLCAGGCSGCTTCHAPPVNPLPTADRTDRLLPFSPVTVSAPPPGTVFRPPIDTAA